MTVIPITCDNCGAKYKLPPTFKGTQAKCQKCGSVIDVAAQRAAMEGGDDGGSAKPAAAAKPAAGAKPARSRASAAAKPAVDRSKKAGSGSSARGAKASDSKAGGRSGRSRRGASDDDGDASPRRGGRETKKKNNMPLIGGVLGLVVIGVVVGVWAMGQGDNKGKGDETAQKNEQSANTGDNATTPSANEGTNTPDGGNEMPKPEGAGEKPKEDPAPVIKEPPPAPKASGRLFPDLPKEQREPWMNQRNPAHSMEEVQSAADQFGELQWSESISEDKKKEILELVDSLDPEGGIAAIRAKNSLIKEGYAGMFGIVEKLRQLDYRQAEDAAFGFELNKALEDVTGGRNARYQPVQAGEEVHPAKAQWNTKTVGAWMKILGSWSNEAAFKKAKRELKKKNSDN